MSSEELGTLRHRNPGTVGQNSSGHNHANFVETPEAIRYLVIPFNKWQPPKKVSCQSKTSFIKAFSVVYADSRDVNQERGNQTVPVQLLGDLVAVIAPVLITITFGFAWGKKGFPFDTEQITRLVTLVGTPCLVVSTLLKVSPTLDALGSVALIAVITHTVLGLIGAVLLKTTGLSNKVYLPSLIFANNGNMGLPLCLFAFGESGLALAIAYFTVTAVGQFTVGQAISAGKGSIRRVLRTPLIWGVAVALVLVASETRLPLWMSNTLELIGQLTIPLMLLALGVSLSRLEVRTLGRSTALAGFRIGGGLALGFLAVVLFGLTGEERGVVLIQASMPVAVFNYLFAQFYDNRPEEIAGLVVISTAMSFLVLPFLLAVVL